MYVNLDVTISDVTQLMVVCWLLQTTPYIGIFPFVFELVESIYGVVGSWHSWSLSETVDSTHVEDTPCKNMTEIDNRKNVYFRYYYRFNFLLVS